jgi:uncharacterized protein (TIGR02117 family)
MSRSRIAGGFARPLMALIAALFLLMQGAASAQPAPADAGCIEIALQSNGFHSNLVLPAAVLPEGHALLRLYPQAHWFAVGWGDEDYYREPDGGTAMQGLRAAFGGGPTVLHVIAFREAPEDYFGAETVTRAGVTRAGAARMAAYVDEEIARQPEGGPVIVAEGHHAGRSLFLRGQDDNFHLLNNCNHWAARGLREAGLDVPGAITANGVVNRLRAVGGPCPGAE